MMGGGTADSQGKRVRGERTTLNAACLPPESDIRRTQHFGGGTNPPENVVTGTPTCTTDGQGQKPRWNSYVRDHGRNARPHTQFGCNNVALLKAVILL